MSTKIAIESIAEFAGAAITLKKTVEALKSPQWRGTDKEKLEAAYEALGVLINGAIQFAHAVGTVQGYSALELAEASAQAATKLMKEAEEMVEETQGQDSRPPDEPPPTLH